MEKRDQTPMKNERVRTSRQRYFRFVDDYKHGRLDKDDFEKPKPQSEDDEKAEEQPKDPNERKAKRREYLRAYFRWLWPHRYAVAVVFVLAPTSADARRCR